MGNQINESFVRVVADGVVNEFYECNKLHGEADIVFHGPNGITAYVKNIPDDTESVMLEVCMNGRASKSEMVPVVYDKDGKRGVFVPFINAIVLFDEFTACDDECGVDVTESQVKIMIKETVDRVQKSMNEGLMSMRNNAINQNIELDNACFEVLKFISELRQFPGMQISVKVKGRSYSKPYTIKKDEPVISNVVEARMAEYHLSSDGRADAETLFGFIQFLRGKLKISNGLNSLMEKHNLRLSDFELIISNIKEDEVAAIVNANVGFKRDGIFSRLTGGTSCCITLEALINNLSAVKELLFT